MVYLECVLQTGWSPLHIASHRRHADVVKVLCQHNPATVTVQDKSGNTPLHCATMAGAVEVADLLLCHSADINAANKVPVS
eukprot:m.40615 g.40615  ORF g.40615 m.40615 type:complete len:81 (-) comp12764_c0_seq2:419-661(-)